MKIGTVIFEGSKDNKKWLAYPQRLGVVSHSAVSYNDHNGEEPFAEITYSNFICGFEVKTLNNQGLNNYYLKIMKKAVRRLNWRYK